jgi:starch synthase
VSGSGTAFEKPQTGGAPPLVLWLAAEAVPWASTGGLGDVVGSLPAVLRAKGWDVRLCLPLYADARKFPIGPVIMNVDLDVGFGRRRVGAVIREALDPPGGVPTYLVECPLFERRGIYGADGDFYSDNPFRFGVWQLAARHLAAMMMPAPALIHCHDWHAALTPALVKMPGQWPAERRDVRTILTIHNLQYPGQCEPGVLTELGLPREFWHPQWLEHFGSANFLKGGILSADRITTVSRSYAEEIRTPAMGMGLDGPLRDRAGDLLGIVNGIDVVSWNPAADSNLAAPFDADHPTGRATNQAALRQELGLADGEGAGKGKGKAAGKARPLLGFVGRLTDSKGADLLIQSVPALMILGFDVVVLGTGERRLEQALRALEVTYPEHFRAILRFDGALARRLYAGVDMMLVPSRIEPCGLVQLYALRYGAVPIVHGVGGLRDTVTDGETGFVFAEPTVPALLGAVRRALDCFVEKRAWQALVAAGMHQDFSWTRSAAGYDGLYRDVLAAPPRLRSLPPPEDDQALFVDYGPPLPARLAAESLQLMVQGPRRLYAYWETNEPGPLTLLLEERPTGHAFILSANLPPVGEYWIPAQPEHAYRILLRRRNGTEVRLSNLVLTARDTPVPPGEENPVWLDRLLADGAVDEQHVADRWATIFPEALQVFVGMPPWWPGRDTLLGDHVPASAAPERSS